MLIDTNKLPATIEELGKACELRAIASHGGAPDSIIARQRKAWQKAARMLAQVAVDLRLENC
jgi:predicted TIM-barrel fold metal-dependent hydrolase